MTLTKDRKERVTPTGRINPPGPEVQKLSRKKDLGSVAAVSDAITNFKRPVKDKLAAFLAECDALSSAPDLKIPKDLAEIPDLLDDIECARLRLQKKCEALKKMETTLEEHLIQNVPKSKAGGVVGQRMRAELYSKEIPRVEDWPKFYAHVAKTKEWDLLQRRVNDGAVKERWEAKKAIPGVGKFTAIKVSLTKRGGKK
jgi:hypothetical protein